MPREKRFSIKENLTSKRFYGYQLEDSLSARAMWTFIVKPDFLLMVT